jgi:RecJ-like exonuclease
MDRYKSFKQQIAAAAEKFSELDKKETIRVVSHLDADGISACAILVKALNLDNRKYSISIIPQLNEKIIREFNEEKYSCYFFTDLGSGQISLVKQHMSDKTVFVLDHHEIVEEQLPESIVQVNPHLCGLDGSKEISGAGVVYLFAKSLKPDIGLAHIAVIGAVGDIQEDNGFKPLNEEILMEAVKDGSIKVDRGIRFFGRQTRPLYKMLEYSTDPYIPGVSGSESGAIQFLQQMGISPRTSEGWKKIIHLTEAETKKLVAGIIMRRVNEKDPEDILGNIYTLLKEERESPTRDAREFSTLLNACGRMKKASLGIGTCLGDSRIRLKAIRLLTDYKKAIISAMKWYNENKEKPGKVIKKGNYVIINAEENVRSTMIGTIASILSKSGSMEQGTYILSMAQQDDGTTKASLRMAGIDRYEKRGEIDLKDVIADITKQSGGEAGGHTYAAGAIIPTEKEPEFIEAAQRVLEKLSIEEKLVE